MADQLVQKGSTFLTTLWRLTAKDGTGVSVASGTRKIVHGGVTYLPKPMSPSEQQLIENLDPSNLELVMPLDSVGVTKAQILGGKWDQARVEIRVYDYNAGAPVREWVGLLSEVTMNNGQLKAEVLDLSILLTQPIGDLYSDQCRADHGDAACGRTPATFALTVLAVTSRSEFTVTHTQASADYFEFGKATFTSGANNTLPKEIKTATQEGAALRVKLVEAMRSDIAPGDAVTLSEGCQKTVEACIAKNNTKRFRGEPRIPGIYKITRFPE